MFDSIGDGIRKIAGGVGDIVSAPFDMVDEVIDGETRKEREERILRERREREWRERT